MMVSLRSKAKVSKQEKLRIESLEQRWLLTSDWQNPVDPLNVDGVDGDGATPLDALEVINELEVSEEMEPCLPLGLATWKTTGAIRKLRYRRLE